MSIDAQQLCYISTNIIRKEWVNYDAFKKGSYEKLLDGVEPSNFNKIFDRFCELTEKGIEVLHFTRSHRIGKLLTELTGGVEITMLCIVPVGLVFGKEVLERYFKLLIAASIRIDCGKRLSFNPMAYQTAISHILTAILKGASEEACYAEFTKILRPKIVDDAMFRKKFSEYEFAKNSYSKAILQFIVELTDTHESSLNSGCIDLEHIHAQSKPDTLEVGSRIHAIGNLTLFCSTNSADLKGNRSLKDLPFLEKVSQYEKSNIKMTRDLLKYTPTGFSDTQILERGNELITLLHSITGAILS
jgi:hypothetical protein